MWMENIESGITKYRMFELKKNSKLKVLITYVNNNEIVEIKKQKIELKYKNYLSKEELADILINNKVHDNITYNSYRIMNFNLNLEPGELENFLERELLKDDETIDDDETTDDDAEYETFTNNYNNLVDVKLNDSINMFEDLNMMMIILQKRKPSRHQTRKKRYSIPESKNGVKHIACNIKKRKTKRFINF